MTDQTKFLISPSIDVEGVHGDEPFKDFAESSLELAEIFDHYSIQATFFVDVYEWALWGKETVGSLCKRLNEFNQDVQLHTHPSWADDPHDQDWLRKKKREDCLFPQEKNKLAALSLGECIHFINQGADFIEKWTGKRPTIHRGGGYSISETAIDALRQCGFVADCSMHYGHPNCHSVWSKNRVIEKNNFYQFPLSVANYHLKVGGWTIIKKLVKADLDAWVYQDFLKYIQNAEQVGLARMDLFMHSYSLKDFDYPYRNIRKSNRKKDLLREIIEWALQEKNIEILSYQQTMKSIQEKKLVFDEIDEIPNITSSKQFIKKAFQKVRFKSYDLLGI